MADSSLARGENQENKTGNDSSARAIQLLEESTKLLSSQPTNSPAKGGIFRWFNYR